MTQDEIIELAIQGHASTRDAIRWAMNQAIKEEREAIAQMIEDAPALVEFVKNDQGGCLMCGFTPKIAAATIRARNNT